MTAKTLKHLNMSTINSTYIYMLTVNKFKIRLVANKL